MAKNVVIIGGGLSSKNAAQNILKKGKDLQVTIIQANRFVEWPLAMTLCLVNPELHDKTLATDCTKFQVPKVAYTYGVVVGVDTKAKQVMLASRQAVPYDALVVATGFSVPLLYPSLGVSVDDRKAEVRRVGDAIRQAKCVVVAGGGPIGLELAGDIRIEHPGKKVVLLTRGQPLGQWPERKRCKLEAQLRKMDIDVVGISVAAPSEPSLQPGTVRTDVGDLAYDVYLPAFSQGPNTKFLEGEGGITEPGTGRIDVNEFLQSKVCPEIFAVGVSNAPVSFIGIAKLQTQWEDATANVVAILSDKPLKKHKEGATFMKLPPLVLVGHGSGGYGWLDFGNMPPPCKLCCCCGYAGFPCCPPCWPCCACGGCGACPCGYCCMPPEGSGPSKLGGKMAFMSSGFHFKGVGEAPKQQSMQ